MEHIGIEPGRLHLSWISSAEANRFVEVVREVTLAVKAAGPNKTLKKPVTVHGFKGSGFTDNVNL
jgi:coenzyme F420-reducing hydrogenase delta subunit